MLTCDVTLTLPRQSSPINITTYHPYYGAVELL